MKLFLLGACLLILADIVCVEVGAYEYIDTTLEQHGYEGRLSVDSATGLLSPPNLPDDQLRWLTIYGKYESKYCKANWYYKKPEKGYEYLYRHMEPYWCRDGGRESGYSTCCAGVECACSGAFETTCKCKIPKNG